MKTRGIWRTLAALIVVAPLAITATASSEEPAAIPVKTPDRGWVGDPSADGAWFGWWYSKGGGEPCEDRNYFVQRGDGPRIRVNPKGTRAVSGSVDDRTVVYAQCGHDTSQPSDLYRFDLRTGRRTKLPDQVSTRRAGEYDPTLSGRYLLFGRDFRKDQQYIQKVMLYDRRTQEVRMLDRFQDWDGGPLDPGQVNGHWAVWAETNFYNGGTSSTIFLYDIRTDTKTRIRYPDGDDGDYGRVPRPAVSSDGTVYFVSLNGEIIKKPLGATKEVFYTGAVGGDLYIDDRLRARDVYFAVYTRRGGGIYKITDPLS